MQTKLTERFRETIELIKENNNIPSFRKLAKETSIHHQCFSDIFRGLREVSMDMIIKLSETYDINTNYIFNGTGPVFNNETITQEGSTHSDPIIAIVTDKEGTERILHVPCAAQAGYIDQFLETSYLKELPSFSLPGDRFSFGSFRAFDISGDSMEPTLYSGETLVCSFVEKENWLDNVKNNFVYVLVTKTGIVVKRIVNRLKMDGEFRLISDNSFYDEYPIDATKVQEVWQVTHKIAPFMPSPTNIRNGLYQEVNSLRQTISEQGKIIQSLNGTIEKMLKQNRQLSMRN